MTCLFKSAVF